MNEYQKALYIYSHLESEATVGEYTPLEYDKARKKLEELVEKTKPIKPYYKYAIDDTYYICPKCEHFIVEKCFMDSKYGERFRTDEVYCPYMQAIDWSNE